MPVIPPNIPAFEIRPPCTLSDDGAPSPSLTNDVTRVFNLIQDERHLTAEDLLTSVQERMADWKSAAAAASEKEIAGAKKKKRNFFHSKKDREEEAAREKEVQEMKQVQELLASKQAVIDKLKNRCRIFRRARQNLDGENEDWIFASKHFGITTYYRKETDGSLTCKLEGEMKDCPLFEQICVLKEVDLHHHWSPFCSSSLTIADLDKLDVVGWFMVGLANFGLARDGCFRAIGCDNIIEDGSILLAGHGIQDTKPGAPSLEDDFLSADPVLEKLDIPAVPKRRGCGRMTIRKFEATIHVTSPTSAKTKVVANVNPNIVFLPQSLLDFLMKQLAGVILAKLQGASMKASKHPVKNAHARKIREEAAFYREWILPKFEHICRTNGWEIPRIAALEVSDEVVQHERSNLRRSQTFSAGSHERKVVENMSTVHSSPSVPTVQSDEEMSSLSGAQSLWAKNPISTYLREIEMRTQQRKNDEIAESRQRAANRLIPKEIESNQKNRLKELREAKNRRLGLTGQEDTTTIANKYQEILTISQRFSRTLHRHGPVTRFIVISFLVSVLFLMLHPEPYLKYLPSVEWDFSHTGWLVLSLQDVAVVAYIFACAVPHFLVCDAALVYVFDTLELGSKTGRQVKKFYSDNVRFVVALGSIGVVAASILKAAAKVWIRCLLWCSFEAYQYLDAKVFARTLSLASVTIEYTPEEVRAAFTTALVFVGDYWSYVYSATKYALGLLARGLYQVVVQSNFVGRMVEDLFDAFVAACATIVWRTKSFARESIDAFEGKLTLVSWRAEAFNTARSLFSYTAVFLLTLLILFSLSAKRSRSTSSSKKAKKNGPKHPLLKSDISSLSADSSSEDRILAGSSSRSTGLQASPIAEDEVFEEKDSSLRRRIFVPDAESATRRKGRFRFLRSKTSLSNVNGEKVIPGIPDHGNVVPKSESM